MDILIISNFCCDFSKNDNDRFLYVANMLCENHDVELVTSDFFHTTKKRRIKPEAEWNFKLTFLHEAGYKKNVSFKRFYSHYIFGKNVAKYLSGRKKPDVIYCAVPSLTAAVEAAGYCRKNNVRFVIDIQDLWPEAFKMVFRVPIISDFVFKPFELMADNIYRSADAVCAVSQTYVRRALKVNKNCKSGTTVFLGTDLSVFDENAKRKPILKKACDDIWLAYCGTLGSSYDLTCVFDALTLLKQRKAQKLRFIVMGDGPKKEDFERYAGSRDIDVIFTGRLPYDEMCSLLASCDITVNPIVHTSAASIINKHADYAASGLPVINTQENAEYRKLVHAYQMGYNCKNNDAEALAARLEKLTANPKLRKIMGANARKCAEERFDRRTSYDLLVRNILGEKEV